MLIVLSIDSEIIYYYNDVVDLPRSAKANVDYINK